MLTLLFSCEKDVVFNFNHSPKLCFNCILNPDSTVKARLTVSRNIENNIVFDAVDNASIILYENESNLGEMVSTGNGDYFLNYSPKTGNTYKIKVLANKYNDIEATTIIPEKPDVTYLIDSLEYSEQGEFYWVHCNFIIHDKTGPNNYWLYGKRTINNVTYTGGGYNDINAPFVDDFNREIDTYAKYGFVYNYYVRISDEGFDGEDLSFNTTRRKGFYINFVAADTHYDKYIKSSVTARINNESELPFREPIQIYSNINNGVGIFGSFAITKKKF